MHDQEIQALQATVAALEAQRSTLGDAVLDTALAPLRTRLAQLSQPQQLRRRQIAVLFADVVGSTALAETLGAEDTMELLGDTLRRMAEIVRAHQGRVLRFTGDGVKAAFGMDGACEDDAERAVRAGLAMLDVGREQAEVARQQHALSDFAVRVGVHSGDVALGAGVEADNTAMGAAVHIAARMEQSAPPGRLRISHDTWSQVRGLFDVEPQPPLTVKGVNAPMQTYLVRSARDRTAASLERGVQGMATPLVGRDAELQHLHALLTRARDTAQLQALTLLGDAGLGKSRLLRELTSGMHGFRVCAVRTQPDGALRPWGVLRSLLALQVGMTDNDSAARARDKVVQGLAPWLHDDADGTADGVAAERRARLIGQLAGLDFSDSLGGLAPRSLRDEAFAAIRCWLRNLAHADVGRLLVIVEDLHWADDGSLDLLEHLQPHADELPLALVMTARPALLARRAAWGAQQALLHLAPLGHIQAGALAQALLRHVAQAPQSLTDLLIGRSDGNPYYMEELVRRLIDDGVIATSEPQWRVDVERLEQLRLPGTLVGLLQARLDALPPAQRSAARQASIIGYVFWDDALRALDDTAPQALPALQQAAYVRATASSDFEGTTQRQFDHHLLHQVTYDTLLKAERRLGHAAAARWLRERTTGRAPEFLAMTGEHAECAGETALAADCFAQAAAEAQKRFANSAAMTWLRRALRLLGDTEPARRFELLRQCESVADIMGSRDEQDAVHADMQALLDRHPDDVLRSNLLLRRGLLAQRRTQADKAEALCQQALELAERCGIATTAAIAAGYLSSLATERHQLDAAWTLAETGLRWAGRINDERTRAQAECQLQMAAYPVLRELGRITEGRDRLHGVVKRAQELGFQRVEVWASVRLASHAVLLGQRDEIIHWAKRARALADAMGATLSQAHAAHHLARAAAMEGGLQTAIDTNAEALPLARAVGNRGLESDIVWDLCTSHLELGETHKAHQVWEQAAPLLSAHDEPLVPCQAEALGAWCKALLGQSDAARACIGRAQQFLESAGHKNPAHETIRTRWAWQRALALLNSPQAGPLLAEVYADVQARARLLSEGIDPERVIQAVPLFRAIAAQLREVRREDRNELPDQQDDSAHQGK
jgi:class 3 adenylate cyclase